MAHSHAHSSPAYNRNTSRAFAWGIALNLVFVAVEAGAGFHLDSLALISDAGHNLSDVFSLALAWLAFRMMQIPPSAKYTYGYKRMTILVSLVNALLLVGAVAAILWASIDKILRPSPVDGGTVAWIAGIGILINAFTAYLFFRGKDRDLNIKGAYLHMAADALVSLGVLVAGIVIQFTGWWIIDPIIGIAVGAAILFSTWGLLRDSLVLTLDGVPRGLNPEEIRRAILSQKGVKGVHHIHLWALSTTENALTAHIIVDGTAEEKMVKCSVKEALKNCNVSHATLELERPGDCREENCDIYDTCEPDTTH